MSGWTFRDRLNSLPLHLRRFPYGFWSVRGSKKGVGLDKGVMGGLHDFLTIFNQGLVLVELKTKLVVCIAGCYGHRYHQYRMACKLQ